MSEEPDSIIKTEKELGRALRNKRKSLVIEGPLTSKVISIRLINSTTWMVIIPVIGGAAAFAVATLGAGWIVAMLVATGVAAIIGVPTARAIAEIAVAAGGAGALHDLRKYTEVKRVGDR
jgi:hypothetical protein